MNVDTTVNSNTSSVITGSKSKVHEKGAIHANVTEPAFLESFSSGSVLEGHHQPPPHHSIHMIDSSDEDGPKNNASNDGDSLGAPSVITYYREETADNNNGDDDSESNFSGATSFNTRTVLDSLPQSPGPLTAATAAADMESSTDTLPSPAFNNEASKDRRNGSIVSGIPAAAPLLEYRQSMSGARATTATTTTTTTTVNSATMDPAFNAQLQSHRYVVENAEKFGGKPLRSPSFWRRNRCWLICVGVVLAMLIVGGALAYVFLPQIVQAVVDGSEMSISQLTISAPTADGFQAHIVGRMTRGGPFDASTDPMLITISTVASNNANGLPSITTGRPIGRLQMPAIQLKRGEADINVKTQFLISDQQEFSLFCRQLLNGQQFNWLIAGQTNLSVFGRQFENVSLAKQVPLTAMNRFAGVSVRQFNLSRIPAADSAAGAPAATTNNNNNNNSTNSNSDAPPAAAIDGVRVDVLASLDNRSPISLELGDLQLAMFYQSVPIGLMQSQNVTLASGANSFSMFGQMIPMAAEASSAVDAGVDGNGTVRLMERQPNYSDLFSNYLTGKPSDIQVIGLGVKPASGGEEVEWLSAAVRQMNFTVRLQADQPLQIIQNVSIDGMQMDFSRLATELWAANSSSSSQQPEQQQQLSLPQYSASSVRVGFKLPFDFPCTIRSTQNTITVLNGVDGTAMARIQSTAPSNASNAADPSVIQTDFPTTGIQILQPGHFRDYLTALFIGSQGLQTELRVESTVQADTLLGPVTLSGIKFSQQLSVDGMQSLQALAPNATTNPVVQTVEVINGTTEYIKMNTSLMLYSPSSVGVRMGDVRLELYTEGQWIGYAILPDLNVQPGANQIQSFTFFSPGADDPVGRRMVSNYLMGMATQIRMIGTSDRSTPIAVMSGSLSHLNLTAPMDGVKEPLVRRSYLKVSPKTLFNDRATARFEVVNPFKVPFTILAMQAQIKDDVMREIGLLDVNLNSYNNSNSNNNNGTVAAGGEKVPENERPFTVGPDMIAKTPYYPLDLLVDWDTVDLAKGGVFSTFDVSAECLIECTVGEYRLSVEYNQTRVPTELKFI